MHPREYLDDSRLALRYNLLVIESVCVDVHQGAHEIVESVVSNGKESASSD